MRVCREIAVTGLLAVSLTPLVMAARANVELIIVEPGGKAGVHRLAMSRTAVPGPGKSLRVMIASQADSVISVAAFDKKGNFAYSVPEISTVSGDRKRHEIPDRATWTWDAPDRVSDVYVVLAAPGAADFSEYKGMVSKINPGGDAELRRLQTGAVLRWIEAHLKSPSTAADYSMKQGPTPIGGLVRGGEEFGVPVEVPDGRSIVMRIRLEH